MATNVKEPISSLSYHVTSRLMEAIESVAYPDRHDTLLEIVSKFLDVVEPDKSLSEWKLSDELPRGTKVVELMLVRVIESKNASLLTYCQDLEEANKTIKQENSRVISDYANLCEVGLVAQKEAKIQDLQREVSRLQGYIATGRSWNSPDSLLLENDGLRERIVELEKSLASKPAG